MDLSNFFTQKLQGAQRIAVLGVGSTLRADDAAGMEIAQRIEAAFPPDTNPDIRVYPGETAPENYSGKIERFCPTHLLILDAADMGKAPGDIAEIDPDIIGGPSFYSHLLPLKVMIDYLVGETGAQVTLVGIQYRDLTFGEPMTEEVEKSVYHLTDKLIPVLKTTLYK